MSKKLMTKDELEILDSCLTLKEGRGETEYILPTEMIRRLATHISHLQTENAANPYRIKYMAWDGDVAREYECIVSAYSAEAAATQFRTTPPLDFNAKRNNHIEIFPQPEGVMEDRRHECDSKRVVFYACTICGKHTPKCTLPEWADPAEVPSGHYPD